MQSASSSIFISNKTTETHIWHWTSMVIIN